MFVNLHLALWTRLRTRTGFSVALDDASMKYIWGLVCKNKSVQMFMLQKPRPTLEIHNRYDYYEPELDMVCESVSNTLFGLPLLFPFINCLTF